MRKAFYILIGSVLLFFALYESRIAPDSVHLHSALLIGGCALLAGLTVVPRFPQFLLNVLLVLSVACMATCFAFFFIHDSAINYLTSAVPGVSLHLLFLLGSAFLMVPVVAHYSCRVKSGGCASYLNQEEGYLNQEDGYLNQKGDYLNRRATYSSGA